MPQRNEADDRRLAEYERYNLDTLQRMEQMLNRHETEIQVIKVKIAVVATLFGTGGAIAAEVAKHFFLK